MSKCRSCGAQIIWIRMASGKKMPVDAEPVTYWARMGGTEKIVTPNGEVVSCELQGEDKDATGIGYKSHFSTCPYADKHRRKK